MKKAQTQNFRSKITNFIFNQLLWKNKKNLETVQKLEINMLPNNYYSGIPSIQEIEDSFEYTSDEPPFMNERVFDKKIFHQNLEELIPFATEFNPPKEGNEIDPQFFFWNNPMFSYSDAMAYYCIIRSARPANVVEIGSGFSTLVALEAVRKNETGAIHCIEPYPREFLQNEKRIILHPVKAQDIQVEFLNDTLLDGDILFIDSTHTVKCGSDCLHIYLRLLPQIRRNILVHAHDVFLPWGMPKHWLLEHHYYWTEQYLLFAFLLDNPKATLIYGSAINATWHKEQMETLMGGKNIPGGSSIWFRYQGK